MRKALKDAKKEAEKQARRDAAHPAAAARRRRERIWQRQREGERVTAVLARLHGDS